MTRLHRLCGLGAIVWMVMAACGGALPGAASPTPVVIRIAYGSDTDLGDIPSLMAQDQLSQQGYQFQITYFASPELAATALAQGNADLAYGAPLTFWAAAAKGAPVKLIAEQITNTFVIVANTNVAACADLAGKGLGVHSDSAIGTAIVHEYINENCPGTDAHFLVLPGSDNRAAALLQNELDAALLEFSDFDALQTQAPGQFHVLSNLAQDVPDLIMVGLFANGKFAAQQPEAVKAYLRANLEVNRAITDNHSLLIDKAVKVLDTPAETMQTGVDNYFKIKAWDVNGGLTADKLAFTLDFMANLGALDPAITTDNAADMSYLNAVLDEVGRK